MGIYKLTNEAESDLIRIHQYGVRKFGEDQADKYFYAFFEQFELIAKQPHLYPSVDYFRKGYRRCVCGVDSIYYQIKPDVVEIIAIIGRQDLKSF
ncbi:plasmid stabilization protein [Aquimarina aggregata]|uniref:Plasmid stabilization protein n=1 Tax=Aquimarina aggregata TaxID=1642818 RepID=A0A162DKP3_9FLAO|nr:type II toxin-antitoxin system RelE/ParE family toxin [Aquimarina aggregata]KZS41868.1 plasmid stabilization protein [Aquimarina aggregata]